MTRARALLLCVSLAAGCRDQPTSARSLPAPSVEASVAAAPDASIAALPDAGARLAAPVPLDLPVEGHRAAIVYAPVGTTARRPVLVAVHGTYDVPEWFCPFFRDAAGKDAFVICPRGIPRPDGARMPSGEAFYTYAGSLAIEGEVEASLAALRARFPDHVDDAAPIYAGWSLGALTANAMLARHPERFPRVLLAEGTTAWTPQSARAYAAAGGKRALYICGQPACVTASNEASALLGQAGIATKVVHAKGGDHAIQGPVADQLRATLPWLTEDDPRWSPPP